MIDSLVVPIDGSELATRALAAAFAIADVSGAGVRLVGVVHDDGASASMRDHARDAAEALASDRFGGFELLVGDDPAAVLLEIASDSSTVLCFASHDHPKLMATLLHSVGSHIIEHATHPFVVVGPNMDASKLGSDVVVALDGVADPDPLLSTASAWAARLGAALRIATVYEPVLADLRNPEHFTRSHGPPNDPHVYLESVRERVDPTELKAVESVAIADPVNVAAGLERHLAEQPALMLVVGARRSGAHVSAGVLREFLRVGPLPVLVVRTHE
jgi:nucleotide-binding universal stress UspA family protein